MRLLVGLLTCLSLGALAPALANDPAPAGTTAPSAPASSDAAATPASGASTPASSAPTPANAPPTPAPGDAPPGQAPASQSTTAGQAAPSSPTSSDQTAPGSSAAPAATTTAASKSKTPELTPAEKDLLAQGYKVEMRGTEKHFCRSQAELGTRFTHRVCITAEQAAATKRSSQDFLNDVQRPSGNTPNK